MDVLIRLPEGAMIGPMSHREAKSAWEQGLLPTDALIAHEGTDGPLVPIQVFFERAQMVSFFLYGLIALGVPLVGFLIVVSWRLFY